MQPKFICKMQNNLSVKKTLKIAGKATFTIAVIAFFLAIFELGFAYDRTWEKVVFLFFGLTILIGFLSILLRIVSKTNTYGTKGLILDYIFIFVLIITLILNFYIFIKSRSLLEWHNPWTYTGLFIVFFREIYNINFRIRYKSFNPAMIFIVSFMVTIFIGSFLLMLPNATTNGNLTYVDALFTSTSAVCVTGLSVQDTGTFFTRFGQVVILLLIQVGGLGIMTFANYFSRFFSGQASLESQVFISETTAVDKFNDAFRTLRNIILVTVGIESVGAAYIFFNIDKNVIPELGERIFFSVFHGVSAFCNAGFSTLSNNLYEPTFRYNYPIVLAVAFLIVFGGLGFPIIFNSLQFFRYKIKSIFKKLYLKRTDTYKTWIINLNTKIVLTTTVSLLVLGTMFFILLEYNNTLAEHKTLFGKIVTSFFGVVTPRTAGFNQVNIAEMLLPTTLMTVLLMWIGASPASTGGGIKTSTFALAVANIVNLIRGKRTNIFGREISRLSMDRAFAIIMLSFVIIGISSFAIMIIEPEAGLLNVVYEVVSAYGTVGLSRGITPLLSDSSKIILVITMFLGRVTMLTFLMAFFKKVSGMYFRYPKEDILIN